MRGWIIPPPTEPIKTKEEFEAERTAKVTWLIQHDFLKSDRIKNALLKVPREDFIPDNYRDYAYEEVPFPLPGERATISCPHSYPLFYEPLGLDKGDKFLEVGLGSGYGAAVAREVVGSEGLVVSVEIDPLTFEYAKENLVRAGYDDIVLVNGDGGYGHPDMSPYDKIAITAACGYKNDWRLEDITLYVTLEPCPMCGGAIILSRLGRMVYGAADPRMGCCGSMYELLGEDSGNTQTEVTGGVLEVECRSLLQDFFRKRRVNA